MEDIIQKVVKQYWKDIKKKKNVIGFSGSLKPKITDGKETDEKCFRVYVTKKDMSIKTTDKDFIPKFLSLGNKEVCTDIIEIGEIKALGDVCRTRNRPIKAGCSFMNYLGTACTLGWFAKNKKEGEEEFIGIIANNHCCGRENKASKGEPDLYPSPYDGGKLTDKVAEHWRHVNLSFNGFTCPFRNFFHRIYRVFVKTITNEVDASFERITIPLSDVLYEVFKIGEVKGKRRGNIGELVHKSGRTTGYTDKGKLIDNDWYGQVQYSRGIVFFGPCGLISGNNFSAGGDSSSAILFEKDDYIGGLLFAGSTSNTIYCHYDRVEYLLEVEFIVP